jgi:hypothetical protein
METGYLVYCGLIANEDGIFDAYMAARQQLFSYPQHPAQLRIPVSNGTGHPTIQLVNAPPGLVATLAEATRLLVEMQTQFPQRTWTIIQYTFPDAEGIEWGRS